ncbi:hypothetical protein PSTG_14806 [Puccinia striiformis f. sp. tritici PST-78]|uniref:Large ribosomal subunit protein eL14 domain-containing protein n=2 Tax=Puccinia TaxID=5296 RepID=A0A0L0UYF4_9BASI|nr:hypothetical protein PSTG_14806 [Puccinia striiformis f. sp. tritici PST-78]
MVWTTFSHSSPTKGLQTAGGGEKDFGQAELQILARTGTKRWIDSDKTLRGGDRRGADSLRAALTVQDRESGRAPRNPKWVSVSLISAGWGLDDQASLLATTPAGKLQVSIKPLSKNASTLPPQGSFTMSGHKEHTLPTFQRFVEVGRVVLINDPSSPSNGKLATIVEIIDHGRALIDGPTTSVPRQSIAFRRVILTPFLIKGLPRGSRAATVGKAFEKAEIGKKWEASGWKKNIDSKTTRRSLTDFQRFEVMILKRQRRDIINKGLVKAKKVQA